MDRMSIKHEILKVCREKLQQKIDNAKEAMQDHQQMANEYGAPKDRYDSFRTQLLRKRDLFAEQYQKALDELKILEKIDPDHENDLVEFGAYIETSAQNLFISIGLGPINISDRKVFVISPAVPIFKSIQGLKVGDNYQFNNKKFKIQYIC